MNIRADLFVDELEQAKGRKKDKKMRIVKKEYRKCDRTTITIPSPSSYILYKS